MRLAKRSGKSWKLTICCLEIAIFAISYLTLVGFSWFQTTCSHEARLIIHDIREEQQSSQILSSPLLLAHV